MWEYKRGNSTPAIPLPTSSVGGYFIYKDKKRSYNSSVFLYR